MVNMFCNIPRFLNCLLLVACSTGQLQLAAAQQPNSDRFQFIFQLLESSDREMRALALEQIRSSTPGEAATKEFAARLPHLPLPGQTGLLGALAARGDAAAKPAILELLAKSQDEGVRIAAIGAVGALGDANESVQLVTMLGEGTPNEQQAVRQSLVQLRGDDATAAITKTMTSAAPNMRIALIDVLAARRALSAIPQLLQAALGNDASVRTAAMAALGQLARPEHVAEMVRGVLRAAEGAERAAAEKSVMMVCQRIEDPHKRAEPIVAAMSKLSTTEHLVLLSTLGRVGGAAALQEIETAIASPDAAIHSAGIAAISNWPDATVAPQLIKLAKDDKHPSHQVTAVRALMRVAPLSQGQAKAENLELLKTAMAMSTRNEERSLGLQRASAIRLPETLRFVAPYLDDPQCAQQACETIVELAHHRKLREQNKEEFYQALDRVIQTSHDETVIDRANRYKKGQTWVRPK